MGTAERNYFTMYIIPTYAPFGKRRQHIKFAFSISNFFFVVGFDVKVNYQT